MAYRNFSMNVEQHEDEVSRAFSIVTGGGRAQVTLALGDTIFDMSLEDLAFVVNSAGLLPFALETVELTEKRSDQQGEMGRDDTPDEPPVPPRHGKRWSEDEDREILQALLDGAHPREIAQMVDRSPASVASRFLLLGAADIMPNRERVEALLDGSDGKAGTE